MKFTLHDPAPLVHAGERAAGQEGRSLTFLRCLVPILLALLSLFSFASTLRGDEGEEKFLQELRKREYFDTAIDYLEHLAAQPRVTPRFQDRGAYERGLTYRDWALRQLTPEQMLVLQKQAQREFTNFLTQHPEHPLAGLAWNELGQLLRIEGKTLSLQAQKQISGDRKQKQLEETRQKFQAARAAFEKAQARLQKEYDAFPKFIDKDQDPGRFDARRLAETSLVQSRLNLGMLVFDEALLAPPMERREQLARAYVRAGEIYEEYRSQLAGIYARLYQGRCRQELHQYQEAQGIFQELLSLRLEDPAVLAVQDQALMYRLQIWNTDTEKKYEQVAQEGQQWVKAHADRTRSTAGQGIRWELAKAYEALARKNEKNSELEEAEYQRSLAVARELSLQPGEYQIPARTLVTRLNQILHRDTGDPKDFDSAFAAAGDTIRLLQGLQDSLDQVEKDEEKTRLRDDMNLQLNEAARQLQATLTFVRPGTPVEQVCRVRYWLCYVYYLTGRMEETAILGEFLARKYHANKALGTIPLDAAYLAMAAYSQSYNTPGNADKQVDIRHMIGLCNFLVATWPKEAKADEAMLMLGRLYSEVGDPKSAAEWFDRVSPNSPLALDAQLGAGTAYWNAYLHHQKTSPGSPPLKDYMETARTKLLNGIQETEKKADQAAPPSDTLRLARLTLAQIENERGDYKLARELLYGNSRSVLGTNVSESKSEALENKPLNTEAYRQWLRAAIGLQNLQEAQWAMNGLERVQGGVAELYVALGNQFQQELDRLKGSDPQREADLLSSFEAFLKNLAARTEGAKFNTLAWIGETWLKLADRVTDAALAKPYVDQAAAIFQAMLKRAEQDPDFMRPEQKVAVEFRVVSCHRRSGEFEQAWQECLQLLKLRPQSLELQTEAARILEDWGQTGGPNAIPHLETAIQGQEATAADSPAIWGWAGITTRLNRQAEKQPREGLTDQLLDARYHVASCRMKGALLQATAADREKGLQHASGDIQFTTAMRELSDKWYQRFDGLWKEIQKAEGKPQTDLPRTATAAKPASPDAKSPADAPGVTPVSTPAPSRTQPSELFPFPLVAVGFAGLLIVGFVIFFNRPRKTRRAKIPRKYPTAKS